MSTKQLEICNRALSLTNQQAIVSLDENTKEASACNFLYPQVKQEVLLAYAFKASIRLITLQHIANQTPIQGNLSYKFVLPPQCLKVLKVDGAEFIKQGNYLYSSLPEINLKYISNLADADLDSSLAYLIALKLALELLHRFSNASVSLIALFKDNYNTELKTLMQQDSLFQMALEPTNISTTSSSWLISRN